MSQKQSNCRIEEITEITLPSNLAFLGGTWKILSGAMCPLEAGGTSTCYITLDKAPDRQKPAKECQSERPPTPGFPVILPGFLDSSLVWPKGSQWNPSDNCNFGRGSPVTPPFSQIWTLFEPSVKGCRKDTESQGDTGRTPAEFSGTL